MTIHSYNTLTDIIHADKNMCVLRIHDKYNTTLSQNIYSLFKSREGNENKSVHQKGNEQNENNNFNFNIKQLVIKKELNVNNSYLNRKKKEKKCN